VKILNVHRCLIPGCMTTHVEELIVNKVVPLNFFWCLEHRTVMECSTYTEAVQQRVPPVDIFHVAPEGSKVITNRHQHNLN
jgi:hypothetical protein